jgi:hypothetical protein
LVNVLPAAFSFTIHFYESGPIVGTVPFKWWNPFSWYRPGERTWSEGVCVVPVENNHRGVHEHETEELRKAGDMRYVHAIIRDPCWFWQTPLIRNERRFISGVLVNEALTRFNSGVPSLDQVQISTERLRSVNVPRGLAQCVVGGLPAAAVNCSSLVDDSVYFARDVKCAAYTSFAQVFRYGPGPSGLDTRSSLVTVGPIANYLRSLPLSALNYVCSIGLWRAVAQHIVVSGVMWLIAVCLPPTLGMSLLSSVASSTGSVVPRTL